MRINTMDNTATIARERLSLLFDNGAFTELDALRQEKDAPAAVVCAQGYVDGQPVCAFAQASDINSGVLGRNTAGKIKRLYALAAKNKAEGKAFPKMYIWCGTEDGLIHVNRSFEQHLTALGVAHQFETSEGDHSWKWWNLHIKSALEWILDH